MKRGKAAAPNAGAAAMLCEFIADIEALEEEKAAIAERIRARKADAKACGFDTKVINQMLRERRMDRADREEFAALCDIYRAALGMLDGTPLGDAARKRLMGEAPERREAEGEEAPSPAASEPSFDPAKIREEGMQAAREGKRVIDNPYVAGDPRRALWDEGWCAQTGSDGMEIPAAWRRKEKKKPKGEGGGDEGACADGKGEEE